jgi:DNA-binding NarL/FixJ family response regulator
MGAQSTERTEAAVGAQTASSSLMSHTGVLIVVERRDFLRGCLSIWLGQSCNEFQPLAVTEVTAGPADDRLRQAAAVLIGVSRAGWSDHWLSRQVEWLREKAPQVPIALLVDAPDLDEARAAESAARQLGVQGCITTCTSLTVAVAALRLVAAGGCYFPTRPLLSQSPETVSLGTTRPIAVGERFEKLTPREQAVLSVLAIGAQNKIIAYRLGMSMSTVKAHMHSIIRKLRVRNRTEAVVAARAMELTQHTDASGVLKQAA